jgi:DNA/RNA-binding domain of Phe-tRNA-synthetase-like protein
MTKREIKNRVEDKLQAGVIYYINISIKDQSHLEGFIKSELLEIKKTHLLRLPPGFDFSRKLYRSCSVDPTKHRPSSEALWRRIKRGLDFPKVNPFVDLTNLLSLKYQICYGLYDLDKIQGCIEITQGQEGAQYQGIRKDMLNLKGKIIIKDKIGPFGNPSSDSLRTCTQNSTKHLLQVLFFHILDPLKEKILKETIDGFKSFFNIQEIKSYVL